jgi:hypothetical protein
MSVLLACSHRSDPATQGSQGHGGVQGGGDLRGYAGPNAADRNDASTLGTGGGSLGVDQPDASPSDARGPMLVNENSGAPTLARSALLVPWRWSPVEAAEDPFDDRPPLVSCATSAVMEETLGEEEALGVDTSGCNYLTAMQPTEREVAANELITVRVWHFALTAPEPAEAHVALVVDGIQVLDERVAIPQPGGLIKKQTRVSRAIPAGATAYFHLHNHGENSWALVEVSAGP